MNDGPWNRNARDKRGSTPAALILWLGFVVSLGLGAWWLWRNFPDSLDTPGQAGNAILLLAFLALSSSTLFFARRFVWRETLRNVALWMGVVALLVLGFTFQNELTYVAARVRSELLPSTPVTAGGELILSAGPDGHFYVDGSLNGTPVRFLIDTGASETVLSPADAARAGIDLRTLRFTRSYETANGIGRGAPYTAKSLAIGGTELTNMPISINEADMRESLLGMSFLRRLKSFEVEGRRLVLRWQ